MIKHRLANTRGYLNPGWIETRRTFSNNTYIDPNYMNFSDLEVINDDIVQPGNLVPVHQHQNMEILGYVIEGPCYHNDNLHNIVKVPSGAVQRMSAGSGIWHIEGNMADHPIHYLQIWIQPTKRNTPAEYTWKQFTREEKMDNFCSIAGPTGPIVIKSDAWVNAGIFTKNLTHQLNIGRKYYLYLISGDATINGIPATTGDGLSFIDESQLIIENPNESEMLLFDLF